MASPAVPIQVMSADAFRAWHADQRPNNLDAGVPITFLHDGFRWTCPDCQRPHFARTGTEAISGWDNPQWVLSGPPDARSALPSLGCGLMRFEAGHHWWLRDGWMVRA